MNTIWLGDFDSLDKLVEEFSEYNGFPKKPDLKLYESLKDINILLAWYGQGSYEGSSEVLFEKDGKLFINEASHCSCNGLEGQWNPEETTWDLLFDKEIKNDYRFGGYYDEERRKDFFLRSLIREKGYDLPILPWEEKFKETN